MRLHLTRSLSVHLRETEDHSRLSFHPACPVCRRDRLAGSLQGEELVSRRTQAAIAAGLLVFSTGGAPAALASTPDEITEGTEEVMPGRDPNSSVDFELGGESEQLPDVISPAPVAPAPVSDGEDAGPLEREPVTDGTEPSIGDDAAPAAGEAPADLQPVAPPPAPATPAPAPAAVADPPQVPTSVADRGPKAQRGDRREKRRRAAAEPGAPAPHTGGPAPSAGPAASSTAAVAQPATPAAPEAVQAMSDAAPVPRVVAQPATGRAAKGDRFHTVRNGESLWSIAADLLGEDATVARIAREVHRLWELNEERIGTGQPDLLFAGTRLRLR